MKNIIKSKMTNNEVFTKLFYLTGSSKNIEILIEIFNLGGIKATKGAIKGWRNTTNENRSITMKDKELEAFIQGLFKYRDMKAEKGVNLFYIGGLLHNNEG